MGLLPEPVQTCQARRSEIGASTHLMLSCDTLSIVQNLGLTEEERENIESIISAIKRCIYGHVNETVERRNFRRRTQQVGESFDNFLVSLHELVNTCNFCSDACTQKNIREQIIEGLIDNDIVKDLLQETDLTLAKAIHKCQAQEAAKKQRGTLHSNNTDTVAVLRKPQNRKPQPTTPTCQGCGTVSHPGGRTQCPAYSQICFNCQKVGHIAKVCRSRQSIARPQVFPTTAIQHTPHPGQHNLSTSNDDTNHPGLDNIQHLASSDPAPTISLDIIAANGSCNSKTLPDSSADISAAGEAILSTLNEQVTILLPSKVIPKAVNGAKMFPLGKLPVTFRLCGTEYRDDLHIHPDIQGTILSWKARKALHIFPPGYLNPLLAPAIREITSPPASVDVTAPLILQQAMLAYPTVFDGQIRSMEGEQFHITLTEDIEPFCFNTPRSKPFAYRDKLKAELELLESQHIIAPVTAVTEWCTPIVVTAKKNTDSIRMCRPFTF